MLLLLLAPFSGIVGADENEPARSCEILVDWDSEWSADDASNRRWGKHRCDSGG